MSDRYISLVNGPLRSLVKTLGLPAPVRLRRFDEADPHGGFLSEPVLVLGGGEDADTVAGLLLDNGFDVRRTAVPGLRLSAIIGSFSAVDDPSALSPTAVGIGAAVRQLVPCGRVITLSSDPAAPAAGARDAVVARAAAQQAVSGFTRSLAHELRAGATANGIVLEGASAAAPSAAAALWFLLSAKSAYVSGQFLTVSSDGGDMLTARAFSALSAVDSLPGRGGGGGGGEGPLSGRTAVVTGAARGIGAAVARTLRRDGARVHGVDVPAAGDALAATMNAIGGRAVQLDITGPRAGDALAEAVGAPIDILIHNAGITRDKLLANMDAARWDAVLDVNLVSQLRMNAQVSARGAWGDAPRIVTMASTSGIAGNRGQTNYAASKAGVIGMAAAASPEFAQRGGTINAVAPGFIETEMTARMPALTRELARRVSSLQQGGIPQDVAEAVSFLSSGAAAGINGRTLRVCGQNMVGA